MEKAVTDLQHAMATIRTGRASVSLLAAWGLWSISHRVPEIDRIEASAAPSLAGGLRDGVLARRERAEAEHAGPG